MKLSEYLEKKEYASAYKKKLTAEEQAILAPANPGDYIVIASELTVDEFVALTKRLAETKLISKQNKLNGNSEKATPLAPGKMQYPIGF